MPSRYHQPRSHAKAVARRDEERAHHLRKMLAISVMSALTLGAIFIARAETWVTVAPDGSVSKTEVRAQAAQTPTSKTAVAAQSVDRYPEEAYGTYGSYNGIEQSVSPPSLLTPNGAAGNTTFFAGTYYPVPSYGYSYQIPGYTYPIGPVHPRVTPPMITTLPSTGYVYGTGTPYCYPGYPVHPAPPVGYYPNPVYVYPNYVGSGVYYSGPAGGGGTIYSNSTSSNSGFGVRVGNGGVNLSIGNTKRSSQSTTTVTTTGPRY